MRRRRVAVFVSGTGSNLAALLDERDKLDIVLVVTNRANCYGHVRAQRAGVPVWVLDSLPDWKKLSQNLCEVGVTDIFLAGFMKIIPSEFIADWGSRIVNIHPSLLPQFRGLKSIQRAFDAKGPFGVTLHEVVPEVDSGSVLFQREFQMHDVKSFENVEFYYHVQEHRLVRDWTRRGRQI